MGVIKPSSLRCENITLGLFLRRITYSSHREERRIAMARNKRDKQSRNERMHNVSSPPEKVKQFRGYSVEGIPIYVWVSPPKGYEHDLS